MSVSVGAGSLSNFEHSERLLSRIIEPLAICSEERTQRLSKAENCHSACNFAAAAARPVIRKVLGNAFAARQRHPELAHFYVRCGASVRPELGVCSD
jgi:hypothetical protein